MQRTWDRWEIHTYIQYSRRCNYFYHSAFKSFDDWPSSDMQQTDMKGRGHLEFTAVRLKIISKRVLNKYGACVCVDWTDFFQDTDHCHAPVIKRWGIILTISSIYPHKEGSGNQNVTLPTYLNPELNPICCLLALLGAHPFLHVTRIRVKSLTFRRLMSYIYIWSTHSWCF